MFKRVILLSLTLILLFPSSFALSSSGSQIRSGYGVVASGVYGLHTVVLKPDGTMWTWGYNNKGQLADGTTTNGFEPKQVGSDTDWAFVAAGSFATMAIKEDGSLWGAGESLKGELGVVQSAVPTLVRIGTDNDWKAVAVGRDHVLAIKTDGTLWGWGSNGYGELGLGHRNESMYTTPQRVGSDSDWRFVTAGLHKTAAIKQDGTLWVVGNDSNGFLGEHAPTGGLPYIVDFVMVSSSIPWSHVGIGNGAVLGLKEDGSLWVWGSSAGATGTGVPFTPPTFYRTPVQLSSGWKSFSLNATQVLGVRSDGSLWAWGTDSLGVFGNGLITSMGSTILMYTEPTLVSGSVDNVYPVVSSGHSLLIKSDGSIWASGYGGEGQLGILGTTFASSHIPIPSFVVNPNMSFPLDGSWLPETLKLVRGLTARTNTFLIRNYAETSMYRGQSLLPYSYASLGVI